MIKAWRELFFYSSYLKCSKLFNTKRSIRQRNCKKGSVGLRHTRESWTWWNCGMIDNKVWRTTFRLCKKLWPSEVFYCRIMRIFSTEFDFANWLWLKEELLLPGKPILNFKNSRSTIETTLWNCCVFHSKSKFWSNWLKMRRHSTKFSKK